MQNGHDVVETNVIEVFVSDEKFGVTVESCNPDGEVIVKSSPTYSQSGFSNHAEAAASGLRMIGRGEQVSTDEEEDDLGPGM